MASLVTPASTNTPEKQRGRTCEAEARWRVTELNAHGTCSAAPGALGAMRCHPALHLLLLLRQDRGRCCSAGLAADDGAWVQTSRRWSLEELGLPLMRGQVGAAHALQVHDEGGRLLGRQRAPLRIHPQLTRPSSATHGGQRREAQLLLLPASSCGAGHSCRPPSVISSGMAGSCRAECGCRSPVEPESEIRTSLQNTAGAVMTEAQPAVCRATCQLPCSSLKP